ncbi:LutC/YkgG family protein [Halotalea alkalilenta]|uniref:LutC/YkgG family protein n=1 Tax=Halotalea alkalilenta TaxID=376489 RepID=UPI0004822041|nr:lactate utilization protein C [Halotalea alkalilenta]
MSARERILAKLRSGLAGSIPRPDDFEPAVVTEPWRYPDRAARIERLVELMSAVQTRFERTTRADWPTRVLDLLEARGIDRLLVATGMAHGARLAAHIEGLAKAPSLFAYDRPIEAWKSELFDSVPASLTTTRGAIAATGSLILWPSADEPRLMSLVPPLHIALLEASRIQDNLHEVIETEGWAAGMPTNALLISGPSKTADIEQVLAYGAHGPAELVVVLLEDA